MNECWAIKDEGFTDIDDSGKSWTLKARDYKMPQAVCYAEKRFFEWYEDTKSVTLRSKSGSYGGGSECLICTRLQSEPCAQETIKESGINTLKRTS